jgi:hypothetical protein
MRPTLLAASALVLALPALPAAAGSQSSNSSSNCSNGHCTRVETYTEQQGRHRHGWTRFEEWYETPGRRRHARPGGDDD